jgi:hypothetical protein
MLVGLLASFALYVEVRPDPSVDLPFAAIDIAPGAILDETNSEMRPVPVGLFEAAELGEVARRPIAAGDPVLASAVGDAEPVVPPGWWVVAATVPMGATPGDSVRLVLLDTGDQVDGVVAHPGSDDPFAAADGGVAVPPERAAGVAMAAAGGRLAVLLTTG